MTQLFLVLVVGVFLTLSVNSAQGNLQKPEQASPKGEKSASQSNRETLIGILIWAQWKPTAQITIPFPPSTPRSAPGPTISKGDMQLVSGDKGADLLVLHFTVRPGACPMVDRQRLLVKDSQDKSYPYGGWAVERAEYTYCNSPSAIIEHGPWDNVLWTPVGIAPEYGFLDLVFKVDLGAAGLVFTDGINRLDLDPLILPKAKPKKK